MFKYIGRIIVLAALLFSWMSQPQTERCNAPTGSTTRQFLCNDMLQAPARSWQPGETPQDLEYRLAVYYVIPADISFEQDVLDRLKAASVEIQAWYQVATGGLTWEFAYPEIVRVYPGQHERQYYVDNSGWWGSLLPEMTDAGYPVWAPGLVTVLWSRGAGWWAGGTYGCEENACGMVLLGVELFPEFNNPAWSKDECPDPDGLGGEAWPCTPLGAYAHELGHTLGLIHPDENPYTQPVAPHSIMWTHWHYPDQAPPEDLPWGFLRSERQSLRANPFMKTGIELRQIFQDLEVAVNLPVSGTLPAANYSVLVDRNTIQCLNLTPDAELFYWTFGDLQASNVVSPTHLYEAGDVYTITLRASSVTSMMGVMTSSVTILDNGFLPFIMIR